MKLFLSPVSISRKFNKARVAILRAFLSFSQRSSFHWYCFYQSSLKLKFARDNNCFASNFRQALRARCQVPAEEDDQAVAAGGSEGRGEGQEGGRGRGGDSQEGRRSQEDHPRAGRQSSGGREDQDHQRRAAPRAEGQGEPQQWFLNNGHQKKPF